jgi:DNA-directed RNA polymerase specialized sigma24 family protein
MNEKIQYPKLTDAELIALILLGDRRAQNALFERYYGGLLLFNYNLYSSEGEAECATIIIMTLLLSSIMNESYKDEGKCRYWLQRISTNKHNDFLERQKKGIPSESQEEMEDVVEESNEGALLLELKLIALAVQTNLLTPLEKLIIKMRIEDKLNWDEIAATLELKLQGEEGWEERAKARGGKPKYKAKTLSKEYSRMMKRLEMMLTKNNLFSR